MVNGKDVICWGIGGLFFFYALSTLSGGYSLSNQELARTNIFGLIGLAFVISGSIFNLQQKENRF